MEAQAYMKPGIHFVPLTINVGTMPVPCLACYGMHAVF